jgi:hypothetical protein
LAGYELDKAEKARLAQRRILTELEDRNRLYRRDINEICEKIIACDGENTEI